MGRRSSALRLVEPLPLAVVLPRKEKHVSDGAPAITIFPVHLSGNLPTTKVAEFVTRLRKANPGDSDDQVDIPFTCDSTSGWCCLEIPCGFVGGNPQALAARLRHLGCEVEVQTAPLRSVRR